MKPSHPTDVRKIALQIAKRNIPGLKETAPLLVDDIQQALISYGRERYNEGIEKARWLCKQEQGTSCPDCGDSMLLEVAEELEALKEKAE